jgi:hypothetical protein
MARVQLAQVGHKQSVDQHRHCGQAHRARDLRVLAADAEFKRANAVFGFRRTGNGCLTGFCRTQAALDPLEQSSAESALDSREPARNGRLVDSESARRPSQRAGARDRQHIVQIIPVHACILAGPSRSHKPVPAGQRSLPSMPCFMSCCSPTIPIMPRRAND